jgi:ElaB/YqjD/DUF883 family membrane-anchored ribosome-binding protein
MADDTLKPMTEQDVAPAIDSPLGPVDELQPADPLKGLSTDGGDPLASGDAADDLGDGADDLGDASGDLDENAAGSSDEPPASTRQALSDNVTKLKSEATDRVRSFADMGKERATGALDQLVQVLTDAADQVDGKLGGQYGQYARNAADQVQGFSASLSERSVDDLLDDARELVRKSPGVAIGAAATVGFVVARLFSAGLDQRDKD